MATRRPQDPDTRPTRGNEVVATATTEPRPVTSRGGALLPPRTVFALHGAALVAPGRLSSGGAPIVFPQLQCGCWTPTETWQITWRSLGPSRDLTRAPSRVPRPGSSLFGATYGPAVPARPRSPRDAFCLARGCLFGVDKWDLGEYGGAWPAPSALSPRSCCTVLEITYNVVAYV